MIDSTAPTSPSRLPDVPETPRAGEGEERPGRAGGRTSGSFTSESAREARRIRGLRDAERKAAAEQEARLGHLTSRQKIGLGIAKVSQADIDEVISQLVTQAKGGDVKSIHALARLFDQAYGRAGTEEPVDPTPRDERPFEQWTEAERAEYRAALLDERARQRQAAGISTDPREGEPTQGGPDSAT